MFEIDFTPYVRPTRFGAAAGVVLAGRMIKAAPRDLTPSAKVALKRVRECAVRVQTVGKERDRLRPESMRPLDAKFDGSWGALQARIEAWTRADLPQGKEAQSLLTKLSLDSLAFLALDYESEWVESAKRLERIDEEGYTRLVEKLAGAEFLSAVRQAHDALGEGLGIGKNAREIASSTELSEALRKLSLAIANYGLKLSAEVDVDDEDSVKRFLAAMAPLDAYRADARVTRDGEPVEPQPEGPQPVTPSDPIPPVL
jgi:hypothetical protein